jgi:multidrug resistance efflux pump
MQKYIRISLGSLAVLSILLAGCSTAVANSEQTSADVVSQPLATLNDDKVSASAEVVAEKWANLAFMVGAQEVNILVGAGADVKAGDVLALLPDDALPQSILAAQADLILAQKNLDDLLRSDVGLAQAVIALRIAQEEYDKAFDYRDSLNGLITLTEVTTKIERTPLGKVEVPKVKEYEGYAGQETIAKADEDLALDKARLDEAQRELERLSNLQESADVRAAQTRLAAIQSAIAQSELTAPFDGTVVELYSRTGEMVSPGAPVLLLADLSTLQVRTTDLNEVDVARVQIGDAVRVTFDALPDTSVMGRVAQISFKNAPGSGVYFDVIIDLEEIPAGLRWGMSAFVEIEVSK